jgi:hypothetical protein
MGNVTSSRSVTRSKAEYEVIADQLLADIRQLNELMQKDRAEIDRLKIETRRLRETAACLEAEKRATLLRLKAVLA